MLKTILAISGKPGLYKLVSRGNKMLIVETVDSAKKRMPAYGADKVVSLADISIYTDDDNEVSLASVFESIKAKYEGKLVDISSNKADKQSVIDFFEAVLPNYDRDRVRVSDMRKVIAWYNILVANGITEFEEKTEETENTENTEEAAEASAE